MRFGTIAVVASALMLSACSGSNELTRAGALQTVSERNFLGIFVPVPLFKHPTPMTFQAFNASHLDPLATEIVYYIAANENEAAKFEQNPPINAYFVGNKNEFIMWLRMYRAAVKAGLFKDVNITSNFNRPSSFTRLELEGIPSENFKDYCGQGVVTFFKAGEPNCIVNLLNWKVEEVTGITGEGAVREVLAEISGIPTETGEHFGLTQLKGEARFEFTRFDDGWRFTKTLEFPPTPASANWDFVLDALNE